MTMAGNDYRGVMGLDDDARIDANGYGFKAAPEMGLLEANHKPMSEGQMAHPSDRQGMLGSQPQKAPAAHKAMSPEELMAYANQMLGAQTEQHRALMGQPEVSPRADNGSQVPEWLRNEMEKPETSGGRGKPLVHMRSHHDSNEYPGGRDYDNESLGPSGQENQDVPDYNFIKSGSPNDVSEAFAAHPQAISPGTEAFMRREDLWGQNTDDLLKRRGQR